MQTDTINILTRLNQVFYMTYADSFHKTRQSPWNGWNSLIPLLPQESPAHYVDIGCGNGRWFSFITSKSVAIDSAIGLDLDTYLLGQARLLFAKDDRFRFYQGDCIENSDDCITHIGTPNVLTSFGLWHHIPSFELRQRLLSRLLSTVAFGGKLIISFWQFAEESGYIHKLITPEVAAPLLSVSVDEFEEGDYFLGWQSETSVMRYCHSFSQEEVEQLATSIGASYHLIRGSGNDATNMYVVFTRS